MDEDEEVKNLGPSKTFDSVTGKKKHKKHRFSVQSGKERHKTKKISSKKVRRKKCFYEKLGFWMLLLVYLAIAVLIAFFVWQNIAYAEKVFVGGTVGHLNLTGKTREEAYNYLQERIKDYSNTKVILHYQDKVYQPTFKELGMTVDSVGTIDAVFSFGKRGSIFQQFGEQLILLSGFYRQPLITSFDSDKIDNYFFKHAKGITRKVQEATLRFDGKNFVPVKGKTGKHFNSAAIISVLLKATRNLEDLETDLQLIQIDPVLTVKDITKTKKAAEAILNRGFTLTSSVKNFTIGKERLGYWLSFRAVKVEKAEKNAGSYLTNNPSLLMKSSLPKVLVVVLNENVVGEYIGEIAPEVDRTPTNIRLSYSGGKLRVISSSRKGSSVEIKKTIVGIELAIQEKKNQAKIEMKTANPQITEKDLNKLGIKELIGQGTSNFAGSPTNRIHNIYTGAAACNGIIIAPGEEFSLNKTLGEISGRTGYLKELVIKGNRIVPEYGGGLCQIATTCFRAALNTGLPITERSEHRFRVMYYEPAGTDATIYNPHPDLRFINDTGNHILIQTSISGNNLTFDFFGTKDGRTVKVEGPYISAGASPGPAQTIVDPSMTPGSRVMVEGAFSGAKAVLYRYIYRGGKLIKKDTFHSTYIPQAAVYRVGPSN